MRKVKLKTVPVEVCKILKFEALVQSRVEDKKDIVLQLHKIISAF